jgi:hypothetical protein
MDYWLSVLMDVKNIGHPPVDELKKELKPELENSSIDDVKVISAETPEEILVETPAETPAETPEEIPEEKSKKSAPYTHSDFPKTLYYIATNTKCVKTTIYENKYTKREKNKKIIQDSLEEIKKLLDILLGDSDIKKDIYLMSLLRGVSEIMKCYENWDTATKSEDIESLTKILFTLKSNKSEIQLIDWIKDKSYTVILYDAYIICINSYMNEILKIKSGWFTSDDDLERVKLIIRFQITPIIQSRKNQLEIDDINKIEELFTFLYEYSTIRLNKHSYVALYNFFIDWSGSYDIQY